VTGFHRPEVPSLEPASGQGIWPSGSRGEHEYAAAKAVDERQADSVGQRVGRPTRSERPRMSGREIRRRQRNHRAHNARSQVLDGLAIESDQRADVVQLPFGASAPVVDKA